MPIETIEFEDIIKQTRGNRDLNTTLQDIIKQKDAEIQQLSDDLNTVGNENLELKAASERKDAEIADMKQIIDNLQDVRRKQDNVRTDKDARIAELEAAYKLKDGYCEQLESENAALMDDILCIDVSGLQHEIQVLKEKLESDNEYWAAKCKALEEKLATAKKLAKEALDILGDNVVDDTEEDRQWWLTMDRKLCDTINALGDTA